MEVSRLCRPACAMPISVHPGTALPCGRQVDQHQACVTRSRCTRLDAHAIQRHDAVVVAVPQQVRLLPEQLGAHAGRQLYHLPRLLSAGG